MRRVVCDYSVVPQKCVGTQATHSRFPTYPQTKASTTASSEKYPGFSFCILQLVSPSALDSHVGSLLEKILVFQPQVCSSKQQFQLLEKFPPIWTHQRSQGPLVKAPISKKNVKPLELVILLNDINTHFKRISLLLPLKHVLVLFSTPNT